MDPLYRLGVEIEARSLRKYGPRSRTYSEKYDLEFVILAHTGYSSTSRLEFLLKSGVPPYGKKAKAKRKSGNGAVCFSACGLDGRIL